MLRWRVWRGSLDADRSILGMDADRSILGMDADRSPLLLPPPPPCAGEVARLVRCGVAS